MIRSNDPCLHPHGNHLRIHELLSKLRTSLIIIHLIDIWREPDRNNNPLKLTCMRPIFAWNFVRNCCFFSCRFLLLIPMYSRMDICQMLHFLPRLSIDNFYFSSPNISTLLLFIESLFFMCLFSWINISVLQLKL